MARQLAPANPRQLTKGNGMFILKQLGFSLFATLALAATATGQATLTVTPGPLTVGQEADIDYCDPNRANELIDVEIEGCDGEFDTVEIQLDDNGCGDATWEVPDWLCAEFRAPEAPLEARSIQPPAQS